MKCPKCGKDMQEGFFTLPNNFTFYPGATKQTGFVKNQVFLVGRMNLLGKQGHGFLCDNCKMAVVEYTGV